MNFARSSVLFCLFFCTCAVLLAADVPLKVVSVRAVPQWPWEGKIDIYYMVECDDADAKVELAFTGYDGDQDKEIELRKEYLSGDGIDTAWNSVRRCMRYGMPLVISQIITAVTSR